ncbi:MAG: DMT family transporter [Dermatophilaceae bacterium]
MAAILALLAAAAWGTSDFVAGRVSQRVSPVAVVGWSHILVALALSLTVGLGFRDVPTSSTWLAWSVVAGVGGGAGLLCLYAALASAPMGVVAPISSLSAAIPVLAGIAVGERPTAWVWTGMIVALVGTVLVSGPHLSVSVSARPVLLAAAAAVLLGAGLVGLGAAAQVSLIHTLWAMRVTSGLGYAALGLVRRSSGGIGRRDLAVIGAIGAGDLLANALFAAATTAGLLSVSAVLGSLYPVATIGLAWAVLKERLGAIQYLGVVLAMAGVGLIAGASSG